MFETNPEIAIVCVASGLLLVARGIDALMKKRIPVRKTAGFPFKYEDLTLAGHPRLFRLTAYGIMVLGLFFICFPFVIQYFF